MSQSNHAALAPAVIELEGIVQQADSKLNMAFQNAALKASDFMARSIPERKLILSPFFKEGDYGIIFAPRGIGKSWLSLLMGKAISEGMMMGNHWHSSQANKVLYLDSEMNLHDLQQRCKELCIKSDDFHVLSHEMLFEEAEDELSMNLAEPEQQKAIMDYCQNQEIKVLILDNLSTAFLGLKENESDSWERISPWILDMRRRGVSVVLVCHAGRNGQIRGTSRREDAAHWILSLEHIDSSDEDGCHEFKTSFTKCRNAPPSEVCSLAWRLVHTDTGIIAETRTIDLYDQFIELVSGGIGSASEIAHELGKGKGTIAKWAKKAVSEGKIRNSNGKYLPAA